MRRTLLFFLLTLFISAKSFCLDLKGIALVGDHESVKKLNETEGISFVSFTCPEQVALKSSLEEYLNKPFTEELLVDVQKKIANHFEQAGFPLVLIGIPEQEISTGCLQLTVVESKLGEVRVKGNRYFSKESVSKRLDLIPGESINEKALLEKIAYTNRNPYRKTQFVYTPGQEPEATDIELIVQDREPFKFYIGSENTGRKQLGRTRFFSGFQWGKAFGFEDHVLSYQYATSENFVHYKGHTLNYTMYMPFNHILQIFGGYSNVHAMPVAGIAQSSGFTLQASFRHDVPLKPLEDYIHDITFGFDFKRMNTTTEFVVLVTPRKHNVNITQLALSYLGSLDTERFDLSLEVNAFYSPGAWLADQKSSDYQQLRPHTKPNYAYCVSKMAASYLLKSDFTVAAMIQSQLSSGNLLPSEQFPLGGHNTVRGYGEGYFSVDKALVASVEIKTPSLRLIKSNKPFWRDSFQVLGFMDYGQGSNHITSPGVEAKKWLLSVGPGIRYNISNHFSLRADWGFRLHDGTLKNSQISFGTIIVF